MSITDLRQELRQARMDAVEGNTANAVRRLDCALQELEPERLLTTAEAADLLDVRSENVVKGWNRLGFIHGVTRDGRTLIPLSEIERVQDSDQVRAIRASDRAHDASDFGIGDGLTDEQLRDLSASRPGTLPWQRRSNT